MKKTKVSAARRKRGQSAKTKGKVYERTVANWYRDMGYETKRGWQAREGDDDPDVVVSDLPAPVTNAWVECKDKAAGASVFTTYAQAEQDAGDRPILIHTHKKHGPHLVVMNKDLWFDILDLLGKVNDGH